MNRPLEEIAWRATMLKYASLELRATCINLARSFSPSGAFDRATFAASAAGLATMDTLAVAKATRWLAVIRRDYGKETFERIAGTLAQPTPTQSLHGHSQGVGK